MMSNRTHTNKYNIPLASLALLLCIFSQSACISHQKLINFDQGSPFDSLVTSVESRALRIQHDDLLAISVQSQTSDPVITAPFTKTNSPLSNVAAGGSTTDAPLYLVDVNGVINMPLIGQVPVVGLTTQQARDTIAKRLERFLKAPIVNVRVANFRFSVLGEVNRAGTYSVAYESVNILEALSQAGDVAQYGNRENILVIRQTNGQRRYGRINLHQREVFKSPYFYIEQGDVIYVEPLPAKVGATADGSTKFISYALPIVSVIGLLVTLFNVGSP